MINIDQLNVLLGNSGPGLIRTWLKNENLWSVLFSKQLVVLGERGRESERVGRREGGRERSCA